MNASRTATASPEIVVDAAAPNNLPAVTQQQSRTPAVAIKVFPPKIAKAIIAVTRDIGRIERSGENIYQKYKYVTWDAVCEKLAPLLAANSLVIVQSEVSRHLIEDNEKGSTLATIYEFTLVNEDGDQWPPITWSSYARLRDQKGITDDKAGAKCHTQAEKYFCIKTFKIPTADKLDSDEGLPTLPKKDARDIYAKLAAEIAGTTSRPELMAWIEANLERIQTLPEDWQEILDKQAVEKKGELKERERKAATADKPAEGDTLQKSPQRQMREEIAAQNPTQAATGESSNAASSGKSSTTNTTGATPTSDPRRPALVADRDGIPAAIGRRPPEQLTERVSFFTGRMLFDEIQWRAEVIRRTEAALTSEDLVRMQNEICTPNKSKISPEGWNWQVDAIRARIKIIADAAAEKIVDKIKANHQALDGAQWLRDVEGACLGCETIPEIEAVKEKVLLPGKGKVAAAEYQAGVMHYRHAIKRVIGPDLLDAG
jgi:ERF superfamily protein